MPAEDVLERLNYDHIQEYEYDLKEDLLAIINGKLSRHRFTSTARGTPEDQVALATQRMLNFQGSEKFDSAAALIRDTAVYYHQKNWKSNWKKSLK